MSILKSASLAGVWGERQIDLDFHSDVNFLIGPNGSGKTTVINLIAAMLTAEYESLVRIPFDEIKCVLVDPNAPDQAGCVITAVHSMTGSVYENHQIKYEIARGKAKQTFTLVNPSMRYLSPLSMSRLTSTRNEADVEILSKAVRIKWLSVHRAPSKSRPNDQKSYDSSVDRRLTQIGNELVRYFSKLAAKRDEETSRFLKQLFPILFSAAAEKNAISDAQEIDLPSLRESISGLIQQFSLANKTLDKNLATHFRLAELAQKKKAYSSSELAALITSIPMLKVVEE